MKQPKALLILMKTDQRSNHSSLVKGFSAWRDETAQGPVDSDEDRPEI
jgi:hypothetical protein